MYNSAALACCFCRCLARHVLNQNGLPKSAGISQACLSQSLLVIHHDGCVRQINDTIGLGSALEIEVFLLRTEFSTLEFILGPCQKLPFLVAAGCSMRWSWQRDISLMAAAKGNLAACYSR